MTKNVEFDQYAESYDADLSRSLSVSGEDKDYFARERIRWLSKCLSNEENRSECLMDFGCGTGSAIPHLLDFFEARSIVGIDVSAKSLEIAARTHGSERVQFMLPDQFHPNKQIDLVVSNGAFHHIPLGQRASAVEYLFRSLRLGGLLALWENNPWNPGTRYCMSRCVFDRDAVTLTPPETQRLLTAEGFEIVRTNFLFVFPRLLHWLRWIEPYASRLPIGAQYLVLARKPS